MKGDTLLDYPPVTIKIWGALACFTRPEAKVERVSYEIMTPSSARNTLQSVYWHPQMQWQVREIWVLSPISWTSFTSNELEGRATMRYAQGRTTRQEIPYAARYQRQPRHNLILRDVAYLIKADCISEDDPAKHRDQFRRRVTSGSCYIRPYLGIREYAAHFAEPDGTERPIPVSRDLGRMLFDLNYDGNGRGTPIFFNARLEQGILHVPQHIYSQRRVS